MKLRIAHTTRYEFSRAVFLEPHLVRLEPRSDPTQRVLHWNIHVHPTPMARSSALDAEGNSVVYLWFTDLHDSLEIRAEGEVETFRDNPYDFLFLKPEYARLPAAYGQPEAEWLGRFRQESGPADDAVGAWAQEALNASNGYAMDFLSALNLRMYEQIRFRERLLGAARSAEETLMSCEGACRDVAVAFVACCRRVGLAARFVSGYQNGDQDTEERHLHAWAEVYLVGGGWRGYDPTHGLAVASGHVPLAAAPTAAEAAPIAGTFRATGVESRMTATLSIDF
ncbi:MAG: transglutaminase family protein [Acidobacteria bacterium]|nr:transglutaminase family protein [Acidobacteriota bacterium]